MHWGGQYVTAAADGRRTKEREDSVPQQRQMADRPERGRTACHSSGRRQTDQREGGQHATAAAEGPERPKRGRTTPRGQHPPGSSLDLPWLKFQSLFGITL